MTRRVTWPGNSLPAIPGPHFFRTPTSIAEFPIARVVFTMMTDATRLASMLDAHSPGLMLFARQWCLVPEDVVQEAFVKLARLKAMPDDPVAWLYRVVRNGAIDAGRAERRRRRREASVARPERWFVESSIAGCDAEAIVNAMEALAAEHREVIVARIWGGMTFEQFAAIAGCSVSSAHRRFEAGLAQLREKLGAICPTDPI